MRDLSIYIVPIFISFFIVLGLLKGVGVYDSFTDGAKEGLSCMIGIVPSLIGLMAAISMLRASGALETAEGLLSPLLDKIGLPTEVFPLALLRPVSGSASLAVVNDLFENYGTDSFIGKVASVMMGSTETTFYTIAVYFGAVGIKNTRHTIPSALTADITAMLLASVAVRVFLG